MVVSLHIPKAGGTSLGDTYRDWFGDGFRTHYPNEERVPRLRAAATTREAIFSSHRDWLYEEAFPYSELPNPLQADDSAVCIHGHMPAWEAKRFLPEAKLITFLRDPLSRLVSNYYYWQHCIRQGWLLDHPLVAMVRESNMSLEDFLLLELWRNYQTLYLSHFSLDKFWFIGIVEHFDRDIKILYSRLRDHYAIKDARQAVPTKNITPAYSPPQFSHVFLEKFRSFHGEDYKFYDDVVSRRH